MVEVTLEDVVVRVPKNEPASWLAEEKDYKLGWMRVLLLRERGGDRVLPIWVGAPEGDTIALRLAGLETARPMPWTLIGRLFGVGGMALEKVAVTSLRDNLFLGSLWVRAQGGIHERCHRAGPRSQLTDLRGGGSLPESASAHAPRG